MAHGANLFPISQRRARKIFWNRGIGGAQPGDDNFGRIGRPRKRGRIPQIVGKNGVPASNTAADNPNSSSVICIDLLNKDVYLCTAWASTTSFTWAKISD